MIFMIRVTFSKDHITYTTKKLNVIYTNAFCHAGFDPASERVHQLFQDPISIPHFKVEMLYKLYGLLKKFDIRLIF